MVDIGVEIDGVSAERVVVDADTLTAILHADDSEASAEPLGWFKRAGIKLSEEDDSVTVYVFFGLDYGYLEFTVRRVNGEVIMATPHPSQPGFDRVGLTEIHPGAFVLQGLSR